MHVRDQVIIITGGGRGIGRTLSLGFAAEGAIVVLAGRTEADIASTEAEIRQKGGRAISVRTDVTDEASVRSMVRRVIGEFGVIDTLVNNAGLSERQLNPVTTGNNSIVGGVECPVQFRKLAPRIDDGPKPIVFLSKREWETIIGTNLTGPFLCSREVLPYMLRQGRGNIFTISSNKSKIPIWGIPAYVCSKHGVEGLKKQMALELKEAGSGINVNNLIPGGAIKGTGPHMRLDEAGWAEMRTVSPPEIILPAAIFLASQEPFGISGKTFTAKDFRAQNFATREATEAWLRSL